MITSETKIRVRYSETDPMGYVYHGNYAAYCHASRTELLRKLGISDKVLEENEILVPVIDMNMKFIKPAYYDDVLIVKTTLIELPVSRFKFQNKIYNKEKELINEAVFTLVFIDRKTRKPKRVPSFVSEKLALLIEN